LEVSSREGAATTTTAATATTTTATEAATTPPHNDNNISRSRCLRCPCCCRTTRSSSPLLLRRCHRRTAVMRRHCSTRASGQRPDDCSHAAARVAQTPGLGPYRPPIVSSFAHQRQMARLDFESQVRHNRSLLCRDGLDDHSTSSSTLVPGFRRTPSRSAPCPSNVRGALRSSFVPPRSSRTGLKKNGSFCRDPVTTGRPVFDMAMMTEGADVGSDMANGSQGNIRKVVSGHGHSCHMREINGMSVKCVHAPQVRHVVWDMGGGVVKTIEPRTLRTLEANFPLPEEFCCCPKDTA